MTMQLSIQSAIAGLRKRAHQKFLNAIVTPIPSWSDPSAGDRNMWEDAMKGTRSNEQLKFRRLCCRHSRHVPAFVLLIAWFCILGTSDCWIIAGGLPSFGTLRLAFVVAVLLLSFSMSCALYYCTLNDSIKAIIDRRLTDAVASGKGSVPTKDQGHSASKLKFLLCPVSCTIPTPEWQLEAAHYLLCSKILPFGASLKPSWLGIQFLLGLPFDKFGVHKCFYEGSLSEPDNHDEGSSQQAYPESCEHTNAGVTTQRHATLLAMELQATYQSKPSPDTIREAATSRPCTSCSRNSQWRSTPASRGATLGRASPSGLVPPSLNSRARLCVWLYSKPYLNSLGLTLMLVMVSAIVGSAEFAVEHFQMPRYLMEQSMTDTEIDGLPSAQRQFVDSYSLHSLITYKCAILGGLLQHFIFRLDFRRSLLNWTVTGLAVLYVMVVRHLNATQSSSFMQPASLGVSFVTVLVIAWGGFEHQSVENAALSIAIPQQGYIRQIQTIRRSAKRLAVAATSNICVAKSARQHFSDASADIPLHVQEAMDSGLLHCHDARQLADLIFQLSSMNPQDVIPIPVNIVRMDEVMKKSVASMSPCARKFGCQVMLEADPNVMQLHVKSNSGMFRGVISGMIFDAIAATENVEKVSIQPLLLRNWMELDNLLEQIEMGLSLDDEHDESGASRSGHLIQSDSTKVEHAERRCISSAMLETDIEAFQKAPAGEEQIDDPGIEMDSQQILFVQCRVFAHSNNSSHHAANVGFQQSNPCDLQRLLPAHTLNQTQATNQAITQRQNLQTHNLLQQNNAINGPIPVMNDASLHPNQPFAVMQQDNQHLPLSTFSETHGIEEKNGVPIEAEYSLPGVVNHADDKHALPPISNRPANFQDRSSENVEQTSGQEPVHANQAASTDQSGVEISPFLGQSQTSNFESFMPWSEAPQANPGALQYPAPWCSGFGLSSLPQPTGMDISQLPNHLHIQPSLAAAAAAQAFSTAQPGLLRIESSEPSCTQPQGASMPDSTGNHGSVSSGSDDLSQFRSSWHDCVNQLHGVSGEMQGECVSRVLWCWFPLNNQSVPLSDVYPCTSKTPAASKRQPFGIPPSATVNLNSGASSIHDRLGMNMKTPAFGWPA